MFTIKQNVWHSHGRFYSIDSILTYFIKDHKEKAKTLVVFATFVSISENNHSKG